MDCSLIEVSLVGGAIRVDSLVNPRADVLCVNQELTTPEQQLPGDHGVDVRSVLPQPYGIRCDGS